MGYTMRFPRALSIRDDLSIADCMTASGIAFFFNFLIEFNSLYSCNGKLALREKEKDGKRRRVRFNQPQ